MTTVVIKRNRKGVLTGYHHVGRWGRWLNPAPECWGTGQGYGWGRDGGRRYRAFYEYELELGERAAAKLTTR